MVGLLTDEETESVLLRHSVGRIGCSENNVPYIVPMRYGYDGSSLYGCALAGRKLDIMRAQPRVCFQVDEFDGLNGRDGWRSVIIDATFEELERETDRRRALRYLARAPLRVCGDDNPPNGNVVLFRLRISEKAGRFGLFSDFGAHAGTDVPQLRDLSQAGQTR